MTEKITIIRNASCAVVWDGNAQTYKRDVDVVFRGGTIIHVGDGYTGAVDETVNGRGLFLLPGFVNVHSHPFCEPLYRGIREEHGVPNMYMTGLYERMQAFMPDGPGMLAAAEVAYCELLLSGVTSIADLSPVYDGWLDLAAKSGLRVFLAPSYASASWRQSNDYVLEYDWNEKQGLNRFEESLALIDEALAHPSGRLGGVVSPAQIDTCTIELLEASVAAARERSLPLTTHAAQSVMEFNEMVRRHGVTPIQFAERIGLLGPNVLLAHSIFIDEHSWLHWWTKRDLACLAESGTSVAHCPTPFARYGHTLENLGKYLRTGINVAIGTDVAPHNIIEEMRTAAVLGRIAAGDINSLTTADVLSMATVGGAHALGRKDLGRIEVGARADLVLVELDHPAMLPNRDPLRSLIYTAADRAVRDVYVDGNLVVSNRAVVNLDHMGALQRAMEAQGRMERGTAELDYLKRTAVEIIPLSLPEFGGAKMN